MVSMMQSGSLNPLASVSPHEARAASCKPLEGKMTHTPGPWKAMGDTVQLGTLCFVASTNEDYPMGEANARLIAAAPALYEALMAVMVQTKHTRNWSAEMWTQARAALALVEDK